MNRIATLLVAGAIVLSGCGSTPDKPRHTISGLVTLAPTAPVCREDIPCSSNPADVKLTFSKGGAKYSTVTDAGGHYSLRLVAGHYSIKASVGMSVDPSILTVESASVTQDISIDTGIR